MKLPPLALLLALLLFSIPAAPAAEKKTHKTPAKAATNTTTGTFLGLEEGDYVHWQMRTDKGAELSLFILKPDASVEKVIARPKAFVGRKCRVTWAKSKENIPEAGGKIDVEHLLAVEWLGKN